MRTIEVAMHTQLLMLHFILSSSMAITASLSLPGCENKCGDVSIPYPFGIGDGCYMDVGYNITCDTKNKSNPKAFLGGIRTDNVEILNISLVDAEVIINGKVSKDCYNSQGERFIFERPPIDLGDSPLNFSSTRNKFIALGCNANALLAEYDKRNFQSGCTLVCNNKSSWGTDKSCNGIGCCKTSIPHGLKTINITLDNVYDVTKDFPGYKTCSYAFLADENSFKFNPSYLPSYSKLNLTMLPVVLDWAIGNQTCEEARMYNPSSYACRGENSHCSNSDNGGYQCNCNNGYKGNPYLSHGCEDIDECQDSPCVVGLGSCHNTKGNYSCKCLKGYHGDGKTSGNGCTLDTKRFPVMQLVGGTGLGILLVIICGSFSYRAFNQRKLIKLREKFFQQNGGLLLQQQISSRNGVSEIAKIFTVEDLKRATNNYDESRVLGQGGSGTVYKGILPNNRIVAIKKSKHMDQSQIIEFINEVDILSQIKHRNVVKLIGCCLETEVPLLVYEFVSHGNLYYHIHNESHGSSPLSWGHRLRIAAETAGALAYLHSAHSTPVLHRDVKSANILLDENFTTKVSDFGASRLVPLNQTQMTTLVQGTLGYLDPECFQTGRLTEKSDVYSFGVVLVELLTGEKPLSSERTEEHRSLAMFFISMIKENRLFEILDDRVVNEGDKEQLLAVAELAKRCLKVKGEERPKMKEVAAMLDRLRKYQDHPWEQQNQEEAIYLLGELSKSYSSVDARAPGQDSLGDHFILELEMA